MSTVTGSTGQPADGAQPRSSLEPRGRGDPAGHAPVFVLTSAYCGADRLASLLERHPELACTTGTGMLPLCQQAMATWRDADGQAARPSSLAVSATRALAASIITSVLAREGKRRWCEVAAANPEAAQVFLGLFPATRFVCLYRACPGVVRAALDASPWGLADPALAPFTRAYPASTVTALTACWVTRTQTLLEFERSHPRDCLRVRFEDLAEAQDQTAQTITSFLGIPSLDAGAGQDGYAEQESRRLDPEAEFPSDLIPPMMLAQANDLHRQLNYPGLPAASAG